MSHAAAAGDSTCGMDVPVGDEGAGAGECVHIGAEGHGGGDFAAVECEAFHGITKYDLRSTKDEGRFTKYEGRGTKDDLRIVS